MHKFLNFFFLEGNSTCFVQFLCPSSGVFHCTYSNGICHTGLWTACEQDQDGTAVYSWNETPHVSESSSVNHQEFFTIHTTMVYVIQVCWQIASRIRLELQFILRMKFYMFRKVPLSIIRSFSLYTQQWYMSYRFADSLRTGSGCSILILLASCPQTCITYTITVCTVGNSWWWTEELSETCRV
jgi:hypothetical protein